MKRLLLFAGLPGVGKSTLSKKVGGETGARIIDLDDFKKTSVDPALVTKEIDPPELRWSYYQKALEHVFDLFEEGVSTVVMDEGFHLQPLRLKLEVLCMKQNVEVLWIEVRCSYSTVKERLRSTDRSGHILSIEEALRMNRMFEEIFEIFPAHGHNHIVINNEGNIDMDALVGNILERN